MTIIISQLWFQHQVCVTLSTISVTPMNVQQLNCALERHKARNIIRIRRNPYQWCYIRFHFKVLVLWPGKSPYRWNMAIQGLLHYFVNIAHVFVQVMTWARVHAWSEYRLPACLPFCLVAVLMHMINALFPVQSFYHVYRELQAQIEVYQGWFECMCCIEHAVMHSIQGHCVTFSTYFNSIKMLKSNPLLLYPAL
jgi:hypothetical protein